MGFVGSLVLGTIFALGYALFLKYIDLRATPLLELCLYLTIMYAPFVVAEIARLSGIVTVLFTGIAAQRYAAPNLSLTTASTSDTVFRLTAHLTETAIFLELGLSVFGLVGQGAFHIGFIAMALLACLIGRAVNIYPITRLYNLSVLGRSKQEEEEGEGSSYVAQDDEDQVGKTAATADDDSLVIPWKTAHMLWFSGLRGAVSYGLARMFPATENQAVFVATTMFIVLATTFVLGGSTELALRYLRIAMNVDETQYLQQLDTTKPQEPASGKLSGCLHRLEATVWRGVVRVGAQKLALEDRDNPDDYQEQIELTEADYRKTTLKERKGASVYDYGQ
jgi:sodium/hydrogen exchanger 8